MLVEKRSEIMEVRPGQPYDPSVMRVEHCDICGVEFMTNSQLPYCPRHAQPFINLEYRKALAYRKSRIRMWIDRFEKLLNNLTKKELELAKWMNMFGDRLKDG